jgi:hypothetical protein
MKGIGQRLGFRLIEHRQANALMRQILGRRHAAAKTAQTEENDLFVP